MSRARVIVGRTHDGYPVSRWQDTPADDARYGFMEPASQPTITTRKATPAELAAADATPVGYLDAKPGRRQSTGPVGGWDGMATPDRMAASRARGAARTHAAGRGKGRGAADRPPKACPGAGPGAGRQPQRCGPSAARLDHRRPADDPGHRPSRGHGARSADPLRHPQQGPVRPGSPLRAGAPNRGVWPEARPSRPLREVHPLHAGTTGGAEAMTPYYVRTEEER